MNPLPKEQPTGMPSWYDPFQEIRTMPKGWDLSSLLVSQPEAPKTSLPKNNFAPDEKANPASSFTDLP
jgi:hypothetical protein